MNTIRHSFVRHPLKRLFSDAVSDAIGDFDTQMDVLMSITEQRVARQLGVIASNHERMLAIIDSFNTYGPHPAKLVTQGKILGSIVSIHDIPYAEHVWLAKVNVGAEAPLSIVWGGLKVLKENHLVAVAPPGALLSNGERTKRMRAVNYTFGSEADGTQHRVVFQGMLCSWDEMGMNPDVHVNQVGLLPEKNMHLALGSNIDAMIVNTDGTVIYPNDTSDPSVKTIA